MRKTIKKLRTILGFRSRTLLLTDIVYYIFFILLMIPMFSYSFDLVLDLTNQSYLTLENILPFLASLPTLLFLLLLLVSFTVFFFAKLSSLVFYCNTFENLSRPYIPRILYFGLRKTLQCLQYRKIGLLLFMFPFSILADLPVIIGITFFADFEFISNQNEEFLFKSLLLFAVIIICLFSFQGIFAVYDCILKKHSIAEGLKFSKSLFIGRRKRPFITFSVFNLILLVGFFLFYYFILLVTAVAVYLFSTRANVITVFLFTYPKIIIYATLLFSIITFTLNVNLTFTMFHTYQKENNKAHSKSLKLKKLPSAHSKMQLHLINGLLLLVMLISFFIFYLTIRNGSLTLTDAFSGIQISSHRGNSDISPENTIPALENAILAKSDYAEIDVQLSMDGVLVLMHDKSLERTAGLNQFVSNLTLLELNKLDVGSWFGIEFIGTHIPTLEEALSYCKGRIKLNIDMKSYGSEALMAKQLVTLIEQYEYEHQCIVSSSNFSLLMQIKELNKDIKTGYILSAVYGNFYDHEQIDFFSIRSNFINKNIVDRAHQAGKEIHAWTVNTRREMDRMKSVGVDCIITDNPALAAEIIYQDDTNDSFIQLLRQMMRYRSFYRITQMLN